MVSAVDVALITGIGAAFGTPLPTHGPAIAVALVLGAASFCALGVAVASLIRNSEAAPAVVQLVLFPLVFISGSYMPIHSDVLNRISGALPVRPFNLALMVRFAQHSGFDWKDLGVLLAWGAAGTLIAVRRFRWDPRPEESPLHTEVGQCVPIYPRARRLTARTGTLPAPWPFTPSRGGASFATA